ncbi:DUF1176 domain-containing protein [Thalassobaculum salexigens]|uniref:DUF1176 domain-containing protein n=1 Tax=Thalassobaculum salexigens TaxID=455360 RepID=UPI0004039A3D|nr:DUF1176 domain-containing protein [Thalassobaculum salexigens]
MRGCDILAAAPRWGRRLAFGLAGLLAAAGAQAADPTPQSLAAAGLLTLPEPCTVSREELFQAAPDENVWVSDLADGVWLAIALCEHHAYQSTEVALRIEERDGALTSTLLAFPVWREGEQTPWPYITYQPWLIGLASEVSERRISLVYKGRGIGDCGEHVAYDLTGPVVRIEEYRAKFECDGAWIEPDTWPLVPRQVLDDHAPVHTDRMAGELLSAVMLRWPRVDWMGHAIARGDLDGGGVEDHWIGGYSRNWDTELTNYHLVRLQEGTLRAWDIPVANDTQYALCQPAASLAFEDPATLAIDDGLCDRMRVGWDAAADTITLGRR